MSREDSSDGGASFIARWLADGAGQLPAAPSHTGRDLRGVDVRGRALPAVNLEAAALDFARLDGAVLADAQLARASLRFVSAVGADLCRARLRGADLAGANFAGARFIDARLEGANLRGAVFGGADFTGAHLVGADIEGADFEGATLTAAVGRVRHGLSCGCLTRFEPEYLACLRAYPTVVKQVSAAVQRCPAAGPMVLAYMSEIDWRAHALAAVMIAAGALGRSAPHLQRVWSLHVDESWASPQLLAALYLVDPIFPARVEGLRSEKAIRSAKGLLSGQDGEHATVFIRRLRRAMPDDVRATWLR